MITLKANQHMSLLIIGPIGCHVIFIESQKVDPIDVKTAAKFAGFPLLFYCYLPLSAWIISTPWKWGHCQSLIGWLMHILRSISKNFFELVRLHIFLNRRARRLMVFFANAFENVSRIKFLKLKRMDWGSFVLSHYGSKAQRSITEIMGHFFMLMKWEFKGWLGLGLAITGAIYVLRRKDNFFGRFVVAIFAVSLLVFGIMLESDPYIPLNTHIMSRLWLQPTIFYVTFIAFGVKCFTILIKEIHDRLDNLPPLAYDLISGGILEAIVWVTSILCAVTVFVYNDRSQLHIFEVF